MAIPSSQSIRSESEMVTERAVMPVDLYRAAMKGNIDVLMRRLQLLPGELQEMKVTKAASYSAPEEINTKNQIVQSELRSATRFGDTVLHLLITEGHNDLALKVFQRDMSLLKAQNKMLETPLHCAAKVGNEKVIHNLILSNHAVVKDALAETNKYGDTALHVSAKHGHIDIGFMLMHMDRELAYQVNNNMFSPLYLAIIEGHTAMVVAMLAIDPTLACTPFSDGMFPIHEAARMGNLSLVKYFIEKYPDDAELRDPHGRNLFHIAAKENQFRLFWSVFEDHSVGEMILRMTHATDYEGNTPLHIAAMEGHTFTMRAIWEDSCKPHMFATSATWRNKQGLTPYEISKRQLLKNTEGLDSNPMYTRICTCESNNGSKFSREWFEDIMEPSFLENKWERTQVIGLGSVLITTVTFAAAFTIPGGYNQDNGTPVLGKRYMFWAFIVANALAFMQGFLSLFALLLNAMPGITMDISPLASFFFTLAATTMVVTFGLGLYVTLAPICLPIAIILLVMTLFIGSPAVLIALVLVEEKYFRIVINFLAARGSILALYAVSLLFIFCLALLSL